MEEVEGDDEDARMERDNAQEEKDIMEVLIDALGDADATKTNGTGAP